MAKRRSAAQRAATARMIAANKSRKRHRNPTPRKATRSRRRYHNPAPVHHRRRRRYRNPSLAGARSFLGELASTQGLIMLASAAAAPTVVNMASDAIVPAQYSTGWTGLAAKAAIAAAIAYGLDRVVKQRKAAIGFAVGAGGSLIAQGVRLFQVAQVVPPTVTPAASDQIAENPALYRALMNGSSGQYATVNGYEAAPMGGYETTPLMDDLDSLN